MRHPIQFTDEEIEEQEARWRPAKGVMREHFDPAVFVALEGAARVPFSFHSNGCSFIPDDLPGCLSPDKGPACHVHDWDYNLGGNLSDFRTANRRFYRNLRKLGVSRLEAGVILAGVTLGGAPFFRWHGHPVNLAPEEEVSRARVFASAAGGNTKLVRFKDLLNGLISVPLYRKRIAVGAAVKIIAGVGVAVIVRNYDAIAAFCVGNYTDLVGLVEGALRNG